MIVASLQTFFNRTLKRPVVFVLALIFIFVLFLFFRLPGLGYDISNSDSARWHRRSESFLTALKQGDLASTYQHYQPGVTLMWLNAPVKQAAFWYYFWELKSVNIGLPTDLRDTDVLHDLVSPKTLENADYYPIIHGVSKAVLVFVLAFLLAFQVFAVIKLFSKSTGVIFGFLMATEPYLIGIDRWFHLTSLEVYFSFSSFFALLLWQKFKKSYFFVLSAAFFVLAVYSKLTSLILLPVLLMVFLTSFKDSLQQSINQKYLQVNFSNFIKALLPTLKSILIYFFIVFVGFGLLWPALWVEPLFVLNKLFSAIGNAVSEEVTTLPFLSASYSVYFNYAFYLLVLVFKLSPITLGLLVLGLLNFATVKKVLSKNYVWLVLLYILVFFAALTLADKKIDRYVIALVPALLLVVSIFVAQFSRILQVLILSFALIFSLWVSFIYYPVYSAYYSPIFGVTSTSKALQAGIYDNSGEYYAQAAFYLNEQGREKKTFVPNNVESFLYFYKGVLYRDALRDADFVVLAVDSLDDIGNYSGCSDLQAVFGHKLEPVMFVFRCLGE